MKKFLKNLCPPLLYNLLKRVFAKPKRFQPIWNTLDYAPMKGFKIYFDPSGIWQKQMLNGTYDAFLFRELEKINLEGKTILDIGAHIGYHSFYFSKIVGPQGHVYAFEPHPKNIERFKMIVGANPDIQSHLNLIEAALSDNSGTVEFNLNEDVESGRSSGSFLETADTLWGKSAYIQRGFIKTAVKTLRLDDWFDSSRQKTKPDIIKIDVEGAEYSVLLGAKQILEKYHPLLLIEIHSPQNMLDVPLLLTTLGYKMRIINKEPDGRIFILAK